MYCFGVLSSKGSLDQRADPRRGNLINKQKISMAFSNKSAIKTG